MGEIPDDALFLYAEYDERSYGVHPVTGEPILPPICETAVVRPDALNDVRTSKQRLAESRGWRITAMREGPVYGDV